MTDILKATLPNTSASSLPPIFLAHQAEWVADKSQLKIDEKGRRTGITWAEAADDVLIAASDKTAGGQNVYYIGYNQDMAIEFIEAAAMWARAFDYVSSDVEEGLWDDGDDDKHIKTYTIRFPNSGHRIVALSSRPANLRGKQGVVVIDEAAFHDKLDELLKAAMALLIWGGKVRVISTHDGEDNPFNQLINEIRSGKRKGSVHRHPFKSAVENGLYQRVCMRLGKTYDPEEEKAWVADVYRFYGDDADEELDANPKSGCGTFLPNVLIERGMVHAPVLRLEYNDDFALKPVAVRRSETEAWLEDHLAPLLETLNENLKHYYGMDFARSGDLSMIAPIAVQQNLDRKVPFVVQMRNVPFDQQQQVLFFIVKRLPNFMASKMDARGNGQQLAEAAADEFGHARVDQVMLSTEWYRANMPPMKAAFEDNTLFIPQDDDLRGDLRAVVMEKGVAKVPDSVKNKGSDGKPRHGDFAVALALAYAATLENVAPIEWTAAPRTRDSEYGDDGEQGVRGLVKGGW